MRIGRGCESVSPSKTRPVPASRDRFRGRRLLSWGWRPFQRSYRRTVARASVSRSPSAVSHRSGPGHGVFLARRRRVDVEDVRAPPLLGLASPSEYYRAGLPAPSRARRLPGVLAPSARADAGAHLPGICLVPVPVRLQGFSPSCRITSPASFRPFKAGDAHGVFPFEASPSGRSRSASRRPVPSCRYLHSAHMAEATMRPLADPPSGPCSPPESVTIARGLAVRPLDAPLGFCRSRAFLDSVAPGFPAAPLSGFLRFGLRRSDRPPRVSIRSRGAALLTPKNDQSRNPSAIFAPRFPSACFELRRPGLAPNGSVTSLFRSSVPWDVRELSRRARGWNVGARLGPSSDPQRQYTGP